MSACSALSEGQGEAIATVEQESGGGGALCEAVCNNTTPCNRKCTYDDVIMTCGNYGVCEPQNQPCHYAPVTPDRTCLLDGDVHAWGTRLEEHAERYYEDVNGNPNCPGFWHNRVIQTHDCPVEFVTWNCCLAVYGEAP